MKKLIGLVFVLALVALLVAGTYADTVTIVQPADGSVVTRNTRVYVGTSYPVQLGVSYLEIDVNGSQLCLATAQNTTGTFCPWDVLGKPGVKYHITAILTDSAGITSTAEINVTSSTRK